MRGYSSVFIEVPAEKAVIVLLRIGKPEDGDSGGNDRLPSEGKTGSR